VEAQQIKGDPAEWRERSRGLTSPQEGAEGICAKQTEKPSPILDLLH
jgi:hypothetical protein